MNTPLTLESMNEQIAEAFSLCGAKLGLDTLTYIGSNGWHEGVTCTVRNPSFFLAHEAVSAGAWKERKEQIKSGQVRHATPCRDGFFDHHTMTVFPSMRAWYDDVLKRMPLPADSATDPLEVIRFGRKKNASISLREVQAQLTRSLATVRATRWPNSVVPADSLDALMAHVNHKVLRQHNNTGFYTDAVDGTKRLCYFYGRNTGTMAWHFSTCGTASRNITQLSQMPGLTAEAIFIPQVVDADGGVAFVSLASLQPAAATVVAAATGSA